MYPCVPLKTPISLFSTVGQYLQRGKVKLKKGPSMFKNKKLQAWVEQMQALCQPDQIVICDGSQDEYDRMWQLLLDAGAAIKLDEAKRPNSYLVRSDPADVARVEGRTYICADNPIDAGPNNNWIDPATMRDTLDG